MEMLVVCILFFLLAVLAMLLMNSEKLEKLFSRRSAPTLLDLSKLSAEQFAVEYNNYRQESLRRGGWK